MCNAVERRLGIEHMQRYANRKAVKVIQLLITYTMYIYGNCISDQQLHHFVYMTHICIYIRK